MCLNLVIVTKYIMPWVYKDLIDMISILLILTFSALEYVTIDKRSLVGNLSLGIGLPFGGCIQAWILKAVGDWTIFHHILFSQSFIMLFAPL